MATTKTAEVTYEERHQEIAEQLKSIGEALDAHKERHQARPADWGLVGDLGHVKELLGELLAFVNSAAPKRYLGNPAAEGAAAARRDDYPAEIHDPRK